MPTDKNYWLNRWKTGQTGWHQAEVEPALVRNLGSLRPTRVLVPLCGKSLDLAWLASRGHEVIGVELSELACESFFREQGISFERAQAGPFQVFRSKGITLLQGDFFDTTAELLGPVGAVYDRAALIALPREVRARYARHLQEVAAPKEILLIVLERKGAPEDSGPPFSVSQAEVESLYSERYRVELLSREEVPLGSDPSEEASESVFKLTRA